MGRSVLVVNGRHRGQQGTLTNINEDKFSCDVDLLLDDDEIFHVEGIPYEDICKYR